MEFSILSSTVITGNALFGSLTFKVPHKIKRNINPWVLDPTLSPMVIWGNYFVALSFPSWEIAQSVHKMWLSTFSLVLGAPEMSLAIISPENVMWHFSCTQLLYFCENSALRVIMTSAFYRVIKIQCHHKSRLLPQMTFMGPATRTAQKFIPGWMPSPLFRTSEGHLENICAHFKKHISINAELFI